MLLEVKEHLGVRRHLFWGRGRDPHLVQPGQREIHTCILQQDRQNIMAIVNFENYEKRQIIIFDSVP